MFMRFNRKKCSLGLLLVVLLYCVRLYVFWYYDTCSRRQSMLYIDSLCEGYNAGVLTGSMCSYLCGGAMQFQSCHNYVGGKETYLLLWQARPIIMKSKRPSWNDYQRFTPPGFPQADLESLLRVMALTLRDLFGVTLEPAPELLKQFWFMQKEDIPRSSAERQAVMESVWSLFQQDEYVSILYLRRSKFMPLIYGTCGPFYFMEYLPSGGLLSPSWWPKFLHPSDSESWKSRLILTLYLLELLRSFQTDFSEPLHICDTKGDNFGRSPDGAVKLIDVDMIMSESKLLQHFRQFNCTTDSDCDFFDCQAACDIPRQSCISRRTNSNVQVLCNKLFKSHIQNGFSGLLQNPPSQIRRDLNQLLDRCASSEAKDATEVLETLYKFINSHLYSHLLPRHSET